MQKTLVATQHDADTKVSVVFWQMPNKDAGLDVVVDNPGSLQDRTFRFYNPADVTAWFSENSSKSLDEWRSAYHKSGINPSVFKHVPIPSTRNYTVKGEKELYQVAKNALGDAALWIEIWELNPQLRHKTLSPGLVVKIPVPQKVSPAGDTKGATGDVLLKVPYLSQRDNDFQPGGSCNVTAYAMAMLYLGVKPRLSNQYRQFEDELNRWMVSNNRDRHSHSDLAAMGKAYGIHASFDTDRTHEEIRAWLRNGNPVVLSGVFTRSGHIVTAIGLSGNDYIVHDPWGNALKGYKRGVSGKQVLYPYEYMHDTMRFPGQNKKWAHFLRRK